MWLINTLETSDEAAAAGASQSRIALRRSRREELRKKRTDEEEKKGEIKEAFFIKKNMKVVLSTAESSIAHGLFSLLNHIAHIKLSL
jgi:hypothetical protein